MKRDTSRDIAALAREYAVKLDEILETIRRECSEDEVLRYTDGISQVLEHLHDDILAPIYREHPDLRPEEPPPTPSGPSRDGQP